MTGPETAEVTEIGTIPLLKSAHTCVGINGFSIISECVLHRVVGLKFLFWRPSCQTLTQNLNGIWIKRFSVVYMNIFMKVHE